MFKNGVLADIVNPPKLVLRVETFYVNLSQIVFAGPAPFGPPPPLRVFKVGQ